MVVSQVAEMVEDECPVSPLSDPRNSSLLFNSKPQLYSPNSADPDSLQLVGRDICIYHMVHPLHPQCGWEEGLSDWQRGRKYEERLGVELRWI